LSLLFAQKCEFTVFNREMINLGIFLGLSSIISCCVLNARVFQDSVLPLRAPCTVQGQMLLRLIRMKPNNYVFSSHWRVLHNSRAEKKRSLFCIENFEFISRFRHKKQLLKFQSFDFVSCLSTSFRETIYFFS
jgi:hypothetical protein